MIGRVQDHLEAIYGIACEARAEAFVVDADVARRLGAGGDGREALLVHEADGALELALYLDPELLARLRPFEAEPDRALDGELDGFCQITEGVSHFLYLARAAEAERSVSLLELEAQAEIDKFASCVLHRWGTGVASWARVLMGRLFDGAALKAGLSAAERWRYSEASRLARGFCERLMPDLEARRLERVLSALRYAYRLGAEAKLRHLAAGA